MMTIFLIALSTQVDDAVLSLKSLEKSAQCEAIKAPLLVNGLPVWSVVDCGASASVLSPTEAQRLKLQASGTKGSAKIANGVKVSGYLVHGVELSMNGLTVRTNILVLDGLPVPMLLGRKDMFRLGIRIEGIPARHPGDGEELIGEENWDFAKVEWSHDDRVGKNEQKIIENAIAVELAENQALPDNTLTNHRLGVIELQTSKDEPRFSRQYPLSLPAKAATDIQVQEWLKQGIIEECSQPSPWNHSLLAVPKKDEHGRPTKYRVCIDIRPLNKLLRHAQNNFPAISDIHDCCANTEIFSELDLKWGYHQMMIRPEDRYKVAFTWKNKQYQFVRGPFGIRTLPELFQSLMVAVLQEAGCADFTRVYLDNIVVMSKNAEEHGRHLKQVIAALNQSHLKLGISKCHIGYEKGVLLGHEVAGKRRGSWMRPSALKMEKVLRIPMPTSGKQVERMLGFLNFLRSYIPCYAKLAAPFEVLRKVKKIVPTKELQAHLAAFKALLTRAPLLHPPDFSLPFEVETDASGEGVGAVLYQVVNGQRRIIQFAASSLTKFQRPYGPTLRELIAILFALSAFEVYLKGKRFKLFTDHKALSFLFEQRELSEHLQRYVHRLLQFDFEVIHKPGIEMHLPDALSRFFSKKKDPSSASEETVFMASMAPWTPDEVRKVLCKAAQLQEVDLIDDRNELLSMLHRGNHEGPKALFKRVVQQGKVWPSLMQDCISHVEACRACLEHNVRQEGFHPLSPVSAYLPWDHLAIDLAEPGYTSNEGFNFILVVTDIATRFVILRPIPDKSAETIAQVLVELFGDFGLPSVLQSDNEKEFVNKILSKTYALLRVSHRRILSYHPRANSAAESYVRLTKKELFKQLEGAHGKWASLLPAVQLSLNTRITRRHKSAPFALLFGRQVRWNPVGDDLQPMSEDDLVKRFRAVFETVLPAVDARTRAYNSAMVAHWTKRHRIKDFMEGSHVMVRNIPRKRKSDPLFVGPFQVKHRTSRGAYVLVDPTGDLFPRNVPPSQLKLIAPPKDTSYAVEAIVSHRGQWPDVEYKVRWAGHDSSQDTWEKPEMFDSQVAISDYWSRVDPSGLKRVRSGDKSRRRRGSGAPMRDAAGATTEHD